MSLSSFFSFWFLVLTTTAVRTRNQFQTRTAQVIELHLSLFSFVGGIMKRFALKLVLLLGFLSIAVPGFAQVNTCSNTNRIISVAISIASGTTTKLQANTDTTRAIIVCNFTLTLVGAATANTFVFEYGTGSTCGTGTTALTGALQANAAAAATAVIVSPQFPFKALPAGNDLCAVTTTSDKATGVVSFVIQ